MEFTGLGKQVITSDFEPHWGATHFFTANLKLVNRYEQDATQDQLLMSSVFLFVDWFTCPN